MRDVAALQEAIAVTGERLGPVTVLVNNAANDQRQSVETLSVAEWDEFMEVNLRHHFFATQAVVPMMRAAGRGSVVNMGSISAHIDLMDLPVYITAKAGIEGLTRTLARELGPDGIRVNCVLPGWVMTERQLSNWITPEAEASIAAQPVPAAEALPGRRGAAGALARGRRQPLLHGAAVDHRRGLDLSQGQAARSWSRRRSRTTQCSNAKESASAISSSSPRPRKSSAYSPASGWASVMLSTSVRTKSKRPHG